MNNQEVGTRSWGRKCSFMLARIKRLKEQEEPSFLGLEATWGASILKIMSSMYSLSELNRYVYACSTRCSYVCSCHFITHEQVGTNMWKQIVISVLGKAVWFNFHYGLASYPGRSLNKWAPTNGPGYKANYGLIGSYPVVWESPASSTICLKYNYCVKPACWF